MQASDNKESYEVKDYFILTTSENTTTLAPPPVVNVGRGVFYPADMCGIVLIVVMLVAAVTLFLVLY